MKFIALILGTVFCSRVPVLVVDKFLMAPRDTYLPYSSDGLYAPCSKELIFENKVYDYWLIDDALNAMNNGFYAVQNDTSALKEIEQLFHAYDNRYYDTAAWNITYLDSLNYSEKIRTKHLYLKGDTLIIAYMASASFYVLDSPMINYLNLGRSPEVVPQKDLSLPLLLVYQIIDVNALSAGMCRNMDLHKSSMPWFYRGYYEW